MNLSRNMKPMSKPKTANQLREVVRTQARDRYNLDLSLLDIRRLEIAIVTRRSLYIYSFTRTYTFHFVKWSKTFMPVMYDKKRNCLNEILPPLVINTWLNEKPKRNQQILNNWRKT